MSTKKLLFLGLVSIFIHFLLSYFSQFIIPYLGHFSFPTDLNLYKLPHFISSLANFDGIHYMRIARRGYEEFQTAFFPLYPILIYLLGKVFFNNHLVAGLVISNISFILSLIIFYKYLKTFLHIKKLHWTIFLFLLFPTSFFLNTVYTESLFFLFSICTFYFLRKEKYFLAGICAYFAALTKIVGVFLFIPFLVEFIYKLYSHSVKRGTSASRIIKRLRFWAWSKRPSSYGRSQNDNQYRIVLGGIFPILGFLTYGSYLYFTTDDPLKFFHVQPAFGASRSTEFVLFPQVVYRYFKIFLTAQYNFQYFISIIEFVTFTGVLGIVLWSIWLIIKRKEKNISHQLGLALFSLINILLPSTTGTFLSIPRFALTSYAFFIVLGSLENKWLKILLAEIFFVLHVVLFIYFIQGYFVS